VPSIQLDLSEFKTKLGGISQLLGIVLYLSEGWPFGATLFVVGFGDFSPALQRIPKTWLIERSCKKKLRP